MKLIKGNDITVRQMWEKFGIRICDKGEYVGFIKKASWEVWFPELDDNGHIISFRNEHCKVVHLHYFSDVKRYILQRAKMEPEYFRLLYKEMGAITNDSRA